MISFWGWLPHHMPGLDAIYHETMVKYYLDALNGVSLYISDKDDSKDDYIPVLTWDVKDFRYGVPFDVSLDYKGEHIGFKLTIFNSGMVRFDTDPILEHYDSDSLRSEREQLEEPMRMRLKGVYYFLRSIFECDDVIPMDRIHSFGDHDVVPDPMYGDDFITLRPALDMKEATSDVLRAITMLIKANIMNTHDNLFEDVIGRSSGNLSYAMVDEYSLYGLSFLDLQVSWIDPKRRIAYQRMFERYLKLCNSRRQSFELVQNVLQTKESNRLSRRGLILSGIAIFVSFLAGSILCDVITGSASEPMLKIYTIIILVVTFLLAIVCIRFVVYRESPRNDPNNKGKEPDGGFSFDRTP